MVCQRVLDNLLKELNPEQLKIIQKDSNEIDEDKLKHNIEHIQDWISYQEHFPKCGFDPIFLRNFLRGNKHNLERTKQKLENYLSARNIYSQIYNARTPYSKDIINAMDVVNIAAMPLLTPQGHRILMFALNRFEAAEFSLQNSGKLFFMMTDLVLFSDTTAAGDIALFDAANLTAKHFSEFFGQFFKVIVKIIREAYPVRLKEIHIVNAPASITKMVSLVKPLLHPKVRNSVYVHSDPKRILDIFSADNLPSNYGGNLKSFREIANDWYDLLNSKAEWFESQNQLKIDCISKKVRCKLDADFISGVEGSFRKLDID